MPQIQVPTSESLVRLCSAGDSTLYLAQDLDLLKVWVASTPQSRDICNQSLHVGLQYTRGLQRACQSALTMLKGAVSMPWTETSASIVHILRGGLNFGLREAVGDTFGWNNHRSAFLSAQRERIPESPDEWRICEHWYVKVYPPKVCDLFLGDVVATGTSLRHALEALCRIVSDQDKEIRSITLFTIGGPKAIEILQGVASTFFPRAIVNCVFFEGIFSVPNRETPVRIKIPGTDLLRLNATMAPEFIESQYENPLYPLERCTIYDAGSRAFHLEEYLADVREYWTQVSELAACGVTFEELTRERCPVLSLERFDNINLAALCEEHLSAIDKLS